MKNIKYLKLFKAAPVILVLILFSVRLNAAETPAKLPLNKFIETTAKTDTMFEQILLRELKLNYTKAPAMPVSDFIIGVKGRYYFPAADNDTPVREAAVSLSKLFPSAGAGLEASYSARDSALTGAETSSFTAELSVPIAKNAFGSVNRLTDEITGAENDIAAHQVVESYEEYLAALINLYYTWYSNYAAMRTAKTALNESKRLLKNIRQRKKSGIAYEIDVNKMKLQALDKEQNYLSIKNTYDNTLILVKEAMRSNKNFMPTEPGIYKNTAEEKENVNEIIKKSRTGKIIALTSKTAELSVNKSFNNLFPSAYVSAGYETEGSGYYLDSNEHKVFAGFSLDLPLITGQKERARYETAKIENKIQKLSKKSSFASLVSKIKNLRLKISAQKKISGLAREKISAAENVLKEERAYYNRARSSLNDLISAINGLEQAKFSAISAEIALNKLIVDYLRVTDRLVRKNEITRP